MSKPPDRKSLFRKMRDWFRRKRQEPQGPPDFSERPVTVRGGPKGRSGAAVAELEDDSSRFYQPRRL